MTKKFLIGVALALALVVAPRQAQAFPEAKRALALAEINAASTNITTSAYVQLLSNTALSVSSSEIDCFNSTTQILVLAIGAPGSEVQQFYLPPASTMPYLAPIGLPATTRISVEAVSGNATSGLLVCNVLR